MSARATVCAGDPELVRPGVLLLLMKLARGGRSPFFLMPRSARSSDFCDDRLLWVE